MASPDEGHLEPSAFGSAIKPAGSGEKRRSIVSTETGEATSYVRHAWDKSGQNS